MVKMDIEIEMKNLRIRWNFMCIPKINELHRWQDRMKITRKIEINNNKSSFGNFRESFYCYLIKIRKIAFDFLLSKMRTAARHFSFEMFAQPSIERVCSCATILKYQNHFHSSFQSIHYPNIQKRSCHSDRQFDWKRTIYRY